MNKKNIWLILGVLALVLILVGAGVLYKELSGKSAPENIVVEGAEGNEDTAGGEEQPEQSRSAAPDFTVTDADGAEVRLSDFRGKPVVVNFWASWCPPCKEELPDFEAAYAEHTDVQFLMVNLTDGAQETVETATQYIEGEGYSFPLLFDTTGDAAMKYRVYSIPTTYFIDSDGNLAANATGMLTAETLAKGIGMIKE